MPDDAPTRVNLSMWRRGDQVGFYANRTLRPVEVILIGRYAEDLRGRVLELGPGAGRLTGYLAGLAGEVRALELSPAMVAYGRAHYPEAGFDEGDLRDLSRYETGSFGAVLAPCNVLDILTDGERRDVLRAVRRVLAPDGLFVMSSHNEGYLPRVPGPWHARTEDPLRFALDLTRIPRRVRNARRVRALQSRGRDHAIVNDGAHDFRLLHYFIARDAQEGQLAEAGLELLECLDLEGHDVPAGTSAPETVELHYVARATSSR